MMLLGMFLAFHFVSNQDPYAWLSAYQKLCEQKL